MAGEKLLPDESEIVVDGVNDELEVQLVDDTPVADRGRPPLSKEKLAAALPSDEELATYSENVQKRLKQMQHAVHDQRRAAEAADREREAALEYARAVKAQADQLQLRYNNGEKVFVTGMQDKAKVSIAAAKAALVAATAAFDAEGIAEATLAMNRAVVEEQRYIGWQQPTGQTETPVVQPRQTEPQRSPSVPKPDSRAQEWAAKNQWFEVDKAMTGFAYGVDAELQAEGITPADPDQYYGEIDRRLRETFPTKFKDAARDNPDAGTPRSPVAPVRRSASGKRVVTLTKSQESMAKRLGLTVAQYAASLVELENRNV